MTETTSRTVYYTATTLDGFIADAEDSLDWLFPQDIDANGQMWAYPMPAVVFTHRDLPAIDGADVRFAAGDVRGVHAELVAAAGGKDVWVVGGGDLAGQFADAGLLDEIVAAIAPVTLGSGRPVFPRRHVLRLTELARNGAFACARYEVLGPRTTDWSV